MFANWKTVAFWVGAILIMVLATVFYQPAAAKTGSLLVWTRNRIYIMDIDTLTLARVAPANPGQLVEPSPGCYGRVAALCWVVVSDNVYFVDLGAAGDHKLFAQLPVGEGLAWHDDAPVSWSPDGERLAYTVVNKDNNQAEWRIFNVPTQQLELQIEAVDPTVALAWTLGCADGLMAVDCELGYKKSSTGNPDEFLPVLAGLKPATGSERRWVVSTDPIFELRWSPQNDLLYSQPKRYFKYAEDQTVAYRLPPGGQLANMSPNSEYTVYYQPFTLKDCQAENQEDCLHLGVWLESSRDESEQRTLIYSVNLTEAEGGLNFIPVWSLNGKGFVFVQEGKLIHYDLEQREATIWYKPIAGKFRNVPVFSPNEEAVAFVDDQGQGLSQYRLVVVNPKLQPVEHIIETDSGFRILTWLPN
jgi:hypothetical protein